MRHYRNAQRAAFTLIELLVVVTIISVLVGLTAAAVFHVLEGQKRSNSEQTVTAVSRALDRQYRAALDMANPKSAGEAIPGGVLVLAMEGKNPASTVATVHNPARAQVIWTKILLKREFPTNYAEALAPATLGAPYNLNVAPVRAYQQAFQGKVPTAFTPQAAECLYLALKQSRRGESFDPDSLGSAAIGDIDNNGNKEIIDAWGTPLGFFRFPTGNPEFQNQSGDPQDPQGLLQDPKWNSQLLYNNKQGVYWFEQLLHLVHDPNIAIWTPRAYYLTPVVASAGKDRLLGFTDQFMNGPLNPSPPPLFLVDPTSNDNIYGYRRFGARGD